MTGAVEDDVAVLVAVTGVVEDVAMEVEVDIEAVVRSECHATRIW